MHACSTPIPECSKSKKILQHNALIMLALSVYLLSQDGFRPTSVRIISIEYKYCAVTLCDVGGLCIRTELLARDVVHRQLFLYLASFELEELSRSQSKKLDTVIISFKSVGKSVNFWASAPDMGYFTALLLGKARDPLPRPPPPPPPPHPPPIILISEHLPHTTPKDYHFKNGLPL